MVRRHPHVFGTEKVADASSKTAAWERQKAGERAAAGPQLQGWLAGIPAGFPSLMRALKLGKRAARAGFDWPDVSGPIAKIREELDELTTAVATEPNGPEVDEEIGDLLFAISNLARHLDVDPEGALRRTNLKFEQRFSHIETRLAEQGKSLEDATLQEMDELWNEAKTLA